MSNLTTLANVKSYLSITTSGQDALISALIPRESTLIENWTGRRFPYVAHTLKKLNGTGGPRLSLPDVPILDVSAVSLVTGNTTIAASNGSTAGFSFDDTAVYLTGGDVFPRGYRNVAISWTAGYRETEDGVVPAGRTLTPTTGGRADSMVAVTYANGVALTEVTSNAAVGQYSFNTGTLTFNASDVGATVSMDYYYVPGPVEQACIEMVGLDLKQRDNLGVNSKSLAGETISYTTKGMTPSVTELIQDYRRRAPV